MKLTIKISALGIALSCLLLTILISCSGENSTSMQSDGTTTGNGTGGSLARFTMVDSYLYTVDKTTLRVFDTRDGKAIYLTEMPIGIDVETIFARGNILFLGTSSGVYFYSIESRTKPTFLSLYQHIVSCDPVVANDNTAFATLRTGLSRCDRGINALDVIDITDIKNPKQLTRQIKEQPIGLGISGTRLVVCNNGLELLNVSNRSNPILIHKNNSVRPLDVILKGTKGIALLENGMMNFEFDNDTIKTIGRLNY